ncbi:AfsR/SARP family transcriptional regulator [Streptomyces lasiicapitis]|uniref:AfsR/SARP family transcriptional regulator n=1 Tax=Streptomyces lasiicapitis TaxID=1923961 RepID=UPI0036949905
MEFRVLGPVLAVGVEKSVTMKPTKALELLTVLLMAPGHRASHASVTNFLWPGEKSNANRIRQYSHQLRTEIPEIVQPNDRGFCQIQVDPQSVDYVRFHAFQRLANVADDPRARLSALRSALGEWRGTALEGLTGAGFDRKRIELTAELRNVTITCALAELECGEAHAALQRADSAMAQWPDDETLLETKVRALQALGRSGHVEPLLVRWGRQFARPTAHLLLARETDTPAPAANGAVSGRIRQIPRQLPSPPIGLVGRQAQLDRIAETLAGRTPGRSRVAALTGMPGVGKTFIAVKAAALAERNFPDGILFVNLGGFSPGEPERYGAVLARFLNDLGVRPATPTMDGMVSAYRTALADRSLLLVLDNARDEDHVRPLLPGPGASAAIVTSRRQLHGLAIREGAELVDLAPLGPQDAVELLRTRLGEDRMRAAVPFADDLVEHCGGLPLALGIMAARIKERPSQALAGMVRQLRQERTRLRSLDLGSENLSVRLQLETSYKLLPPPAANLLWQLTVHPGPTVSWAALRALETHGIDSVSDAVDELMRMSLVTEPVFERYSLHDLVRVYTAELSDRHDEDERERVVERVLRFLLHNAWACDRKLDPARRLPIGEASDVELVTPAHARDAMSWFEAEYSTLTAAVGLAEQRGLDRYTWLLPMVLVTFQWRSGRHLDALKYLNSALEAAGREAGPVDVAMVHRMLAGTYRSLADLPRAAGELRRAVRVSEDDGDVLGTAFGRHILGVLLRESGAPVEALDHFIAALSAFEQLGDLLGQGAALNGIGSARYNLGQYDTALEYCQRSLMLLEGTDDLNGLAHLLFSMGRIRLALRDHEAAIADFERARGLYRSLTYSSREARTLVWLADTLSGAGRPLESQETIQKAQALLRELGESDLDAAVERMRCLP